MLLTSFSRLPMTDSYGLEKLFTIIRGIPEMPRETDQSSFSQIAVAFALGFAIYIISDFAKLLIPALTRLTLQRRYKAKRVIAVAGTTGGIASAMFALAGIREGSFNPVLNIILSHCTNAASTMPRLQACYVSLFVALLVAAGICYGIIGAGFILKGKIIKTVLGVGLLRASMDAIMLGSFKWIQKIGIRSAAKIQLIAFGIFSIVLLILIGSATFVAVKALRKEERDNALREIVLEKLKKQVKAASLPPSSPLSHQESYVLPPAAMV
jgi:hypothetical protein